MKRRFKSILTIILAFLLAMPMTACNNNVIDEVDETKTQLTVYSYGGGVGNVWLDEVIKRFEEKYANESFEEGKTGVQIRPKKEKENLALLDKVETETVEVSE